VSLPRALKHSSGFRIFDFGFSFILHPSAFILSRFFPMKKLFLLFLFSSFILHPSSFAFAQYSSSPYNTATPVVSASASHSIEEFLGARNIDNVRINLYGDSAKLVGFEPIWGDSSGLFICTYNRSRSRQDGPITAIKMCIGDTAGVRGLYLDVLRARVDTNVTQPYVLDFVTESENLFPALSAAGCSTCTYVTLATPLDSVQVGDIFAPRIDKRIEGSGAGGSTRVLYAGLPADTAGSNADTLRTCRVLGASAATRRYSLPWRLSGISPYIIPIEVYGQAPHIEWIGDSNQEGYPNQASQWATSYGDHNFMAVSLTNYATAGSSFKFSVPYRFCKVITPIRLNNAVPVSYQNLGVFGASLSTIGSRFNTLGLSLKPKCVVIQGGINDLNANATLAAMRAAMKAIIDTAYARNLKIVVMKVYPSDVAYATAAQMQRRDSFNLVIDTLVAGKGIAVDCGSPLGMFRAGGDAGNLWDINPLYGDYVHYSALGRHTIAQIISDSLFKSIPVSYDSTKIEIVADGTSNSRIKNAAVRKTYGPSGSGAKGNNFTFGSDRVLLYSICPDSGRYGDIRRLTTFTLRINNYLRGGGYLYLGGGLKTNFTETFTTPRIGSVSWKGRGYPLSNADTPFSAMASCAGCIDTSWAAADSAWGAGVLDALVLKYDSCFVQDSVAYPSTVWQPVTFKITSKMDSIANRLGIIGIAVHSNDVGWWGTSSPAVGTRWYSAAAYTYPRVTDYILRRKDSFK
jgi:lysophospholipase L1-like esterase